jgi:cyclohexadieny/prephenate dehydrogenase
MAAIAPHLKPGAILATYRLHQGFRAARPAAAAAGGRAPGPRAPDGGHRVLRPDAGFATLFEGRYVILTPPEGTDPAATASAARDVARCGAMIETWTRRRTTKSWPSSAPAAPDRLHHLLTADDLSQETRESVLKFAASGFRDFTRIAGSDVAMWRDVFLNNRPAVLEMLARFTEDAQAFGRAIRWGQEDFIVDRIQRGRKIRKELIEHKQA